MTEPDPNPEQPIDRVTLASVETAFEAHAIVLVLDHAGIEAVALTAVQAGAGAPLGRAGAGIPIQVARDDLERARETLLKNEEASVDIDWDAVELGEREDDLPLSRSGRMPLAARIAFVVTAVIFVLTIVVTIVSIWWPFDS